MTLRNTCLCHVAVFQWSRPADTFLPHFSIDKLPLPTVDCASRFHSLLHFSTETLAFLFFLVPSTITRWVVNQEKVRTSSVTCAWLVDLLCVNTTSVLWTKLTEMSYRRQSQASKGTKEREEGDGRGRDCLQGQASCWYNISQDLQQLFSWHNSIDAKAKKELADKAKGKGPLNTGGQGIKKSGKKWVQTMGISTLMTSAYREWNYAINIDTKA